VPPQVLAELLAKVSPSGNVSVNPTPVKANKLATGLVNVKDKVEVVLNGMVVGLKALAIDGGVPTMRLAEAVLPTPPLVELTVPVVLV